jgi:hypothetical protein
MEKKNTLSVAGDTFLSWVIIAVLVVTVVLLGLLSYRILQLQNYMVEFSNHIDEHLAEALETTANNQIRYKSLSEKCHVKQDMSTG